MAKQARKTVPARKGPTVVKTRPREPVPKARTGVPDLLGDAPKTYAFRLEPINKIHAPVEVWGYRTETGWSGWIEQFRGKQIQKTHWDKAKWQELPALAETDPSKRAVGK